jgi:hypothetical protein
MNRMSETERLHNERATAQQRWTNHKFWQKHGFNLFLLGSLILLLGVGAILVHNKNEDAAEADRSRIAPYAEIVKHLDHMGTSNMRTSELQVELDELSRAIRLNDVNSQELGKNQDEKWVGDYRLTLHQMKVTEAVQDLAELKALAYAPGRPTLEKIKQAEMLGDSIKWTLVEIKKYGRTRGDVDTDIAEIDQLIHKVRGFDK